jgi:hypothetical protein
MMVFGDRRARSTGRFTSVLPWLREAVIPMERVAPPQEGDLVATQNPTPSRIKCISEGMAYLDSNPNRPIPINDMARLPRNEGSTLGS